MKAIIFKISFFESFFKVHYTKAFRLSYPTLLPTSILGLLGNVLGYDRKNVYKDLKDFYYGSSYLNGYQVEENETYIQFGKDNKGRYKKGVVDTKVYTNSEHLIVVGGDEDKIKKIILNRIYKIKSDSYEDRLGKWYLISTLRYPYGGQNDFFSREIRILDKIINIEETNVIMGGYIPLKDIEEIERDTDLDILPVRTKEGIEYFAFIKNSNILDNDINNIKKIRLKNKVKSVLGIPLYSVDNFYYLSR